MKKLNIRCFKHLCLRLRTSQDELKLILKNINSFYRKRKIIKKNKERNVLIADNRIKKIHKAILFLLNSLELHKSAHGWRKEHSILTNARCHLKKNSYLCLDLKDCYPNIHTSRVLKFFEKNLGCTPNIATCLAKLTTYEYSLAQGLATSGMIVNLLMKDVDVLLDDMAKRNNLEYTRYGDDITFSGNYISAKFAEHVKKILFTNGFKPNDKKQFLSIGNNKPIITGINIEGIKPKVPRIFKKNLRTAKYQLSRASSFAEHSSLLKSIKGRENHIKTIEK